MPLLRSLAGAKEIRPSGVRKMLPMGSKFFIGRIIDKR